MSAIRLEVCVDNPAGLAAAIAGGADRIELCSALSVGGLTPTAGFMSLAAEAPVPVYAMIRPRSGDFVYSEDELAVMERDINQARYAGLAGVVFGANRAGGELDRDVLMRLSQRAEGLGKTLHRAFDLVPDFAAAIEVAIDLGFERILTSGGAKTALEGIETLERIFEMAAGRITIMPGSGVAADTISELMIQLRLSEVHASCSRVINFEAGSVRALGFVAETEKQTDRQIVSALKHLLSGQAA